MRILVLSFYYYPDLCAGSFRCTALIEQLKQCVGKEDIIEVITTAPNRYASYSAKALGLEQQDNVLIRRIQLPKHSSGMLDQAKAFAYYARQVAKVIKSSDYALVFATSSRLMTAALGAWVAYKKDTPLYLDIRDLFVDTIKDVFPSKIAFFAKPVFSVLEKLSFMRAKRINLVSQGFRTYFIKRYPTSDLRWFTNGIDKEFIAALLHSNSQSFTSFAKLTVLYAGNVGEGQGLHRIIPLLAKQLEDRVHFKIIGDGGRLTQLQQAVSGCNNVELLPPIDRQQLIAAYQQADILFLHLNDYPAFRNVLPSKLFEYAAMGKPIWAGVSGYSAEFINHELVNAAVFSPCNVEEAIKAFLTLSLVTQPRVEFVEKYARDTIMSAMAKDIVSVI